jgi:hypothetical protein
METMTLKLTLEELRLLAALASDQLFRKQFIDPKMPGYKSNSEELHLGKSLVARLQSMVDQCSPRMTDDDPKRSSTVTLSLSRGRPVNRKPNGESAARRLQVRQADV